MTREEQLRKQVEVLREALCDSGSESASRALYAADRIDDEPVEATDWEVVMGWVDAPNVDTSREIGIYWDGLWLKWCEPQSGMSRCFRDKHEEFFGGLESAIREAAAWVRAQGGAL